MRRKTEYEERSKQQCNVWKEWQHVRGTETVRDIHTYRKKKSRS